MAEIGHNITALKEDIREAIRVIDEAKADRTAANEVISAEREKLQARGIHKDALNLAMKYRDLDPEKRDGFDIAYEICRETVGLPFSPDQAELFPEERADAEEADVRAAMEEDMAPPSEEDGEPDHERAEFDDEVDNVMQMPDPAA